MESGWSVKAIHRLIVLSSTYQQANHQDQTARTHDPDLRWLTAYPRRRLSAEEIRDAILAASGQLDRDPGTNESGEYLISKAENINSKIMPNRVGTDDPIYTSFLKRSIYLPVVRNMLPDAMTLFDAADPNGVTAVRNETTVSLQSLFLLNSRLVRQQSHQLARLLLAQAKSDADRIQEAHERILGQPASNGEVIEAGQFFQAYLAAENTLSRPESERQLQAWTSYCQALFCTNEFLYVE